MENRKREVQIIVRVTERERLLIAEKMKQLPTQNLSAYARKMLIDGYIILLDTKEIKAHSAHLQKIGGNLNQIAKRINETGCIYAGDMVELKGLMSEIWRLERGYFYNSKDLQNQGLSYFPTSKMQERQRGILRKQLSVSYACCVYREFRDGGAISHERFLKLSAEYEVEQRELTSKAAEMQQEVDTCEQDKADFNSFAAVVRRYVGITELTPAIVNEFVKRIVVHAPDKSSGKRVQKVDIVWNFIGMVDFPNEPQGKTAKEKTA